MKKISAEQQHINELTKTLDQATDSVMRASKEISKVQRRNEQLEEWHAAIQRQLKKRYGQISQLTIDLKDAHAKLDWYAQNMQSHAKEHARAVYAEECRVVLPCPHAALKDKTEAYDQLFREHDELQQSYQMLRSMHNASVEIANRQLIDRLQKSVDQIAENTKPPVVNITCGPAFKPDVSMGECNVNIDGTARDTELAPGAAILRPRIDGNAGKPFRVLLVTGPEASRKSSWMINQLADLLQRKGGEVYIKTTSDAPPETKMWIDEFVTGSENNDLRAHVDKLQDSEIRLSKKIARLEEIMASAGLVKSRCGTEWIHPNHVVIRKQRRLTTAETDMLITNCVSDGPLQMTAFWSLVEKVQDLYEHVNTIAPCNYNEIHYRVD